MTEDDEDDHAQSLETGITPSFQGSPHRAAISIPTDPDRYRWGIRATRSIA